MISRMELGFSDYGCRFCSYQDVITLSSCWLKIAKRLFIEHIKCPFMHLFRQVI